MVNFTFRSLYPQGKNTTTYSIAGRVGPRAGLGDLEKI
jgi:hypothetical protein